MSDLDAELNQIVNRARKAAGKTPLPVSLNSPEVNSTAWREAWAREAGIPLRYQTAKPVDFPESVLRDIPGDWCSVFLTGATGIGKTHLAAVLAKQAMLKDDIRGIPHGVLWATAPEILLNIRATFNGKGSEAEIVNRYAKAPVLVIDDFGAEKVTDWSLSSFYQILAARVDWLRKTIVTSNLSLQEIREHEPRIASRLAGFDVCLCPGKKDRRLNK